MLNKDIEQLFTVLPQHIIDNIGQNGQSTDNLLEIVMDVESPLQLRYKTTTHLIKNLFISDSDLEFVLSKLGDFGPDNRAGLSGTLHRFSRIVDRKNNPVGLTIRVGRPIFGSVDLIEDLVSEGHSILVLGPPGAGKSTTLRDIARYLADVKERRVVIVDTSNEIAGDGRIPHKAVGCSRRLQVPFSKNQYEVMIEAVENHTPEVVVIDEISTKQESEACRSISQRGVQLIATAHGNKFEDLIRNPPLVALLGGIKTATLGDDEASRRGTQKTVQEREYAPVFDVIVEIISFTEIAIYCDVDKCVDSLLKGNTVSPERRILTNGSVRKLQTQQIQKDNLDEMIEKFRKDSYEEPPRKSYSRKRR